MAQGVTTDTINIKKNNNIVPIAEWIQAPIF